MNKRHNIIFAFCFVLCLNATAQQERLKLDLNYKAASPSGNLRTLTDQTSLRGWEVGLMYQFTEAFSAGLGFGFQDFYQKYNRQVLSQPGSDISAVVTNSIQVMPLMIKGRYALKTEGRVQPFAALGVGAALVQYNKFYGQFADAQSKVGVAAQPELGVLIPLGGARNIGLQLGAAYNYIPVAVNDAKSFNNIAIKAGVNIPLR